jgi:hypothetical protein
MSKGYAAPMAPTGGTNGTGGGGAGSMKMPRDIVPRSSGAFKKGGGAGSNFESGGGKRMFERRSRR